MTKKTLVLTLIITIFLLSLFSAFHIARATPEIVGSMPVPTEWNKKWLEIRWRYAPKTADDYMCIFWVNDQSGDGFIGVADTWLDYGDSIYTRMYFEFSGNRWFLKDLYCIAIWNNWKETSPDNPYTYYLDAISKMILTIVTGR